WQIRLEETGVDPTHQPLHSQTIVVATHGGDLERHVGKSREEAGEVLLERPLRQRSIRARIGVGSTGRESRQDRADVSLVPGLEVAADSMWSLEGIQHHRCLTDRHDLPPLYNAMNRV